MALTLLEAAKLAEPQAAVFIEEFAETSDLLRVLPFQNITGTGVHYNREDTLPGIGFRGINQGYDESTGVINPQSEALKLFGGDLDVDKAIVDMQGEGIRTAHELQKSKAAALRWTREFFKGDSSLDPTGFDGLQIRVTGSQLIENAAAGGALSLQKLDETIDAVDIPTHIAMSKAMRRRVTEAERNGIAGDIEKSVDEFGRQMMMYAGLPILIIDYDNLGNPILPYTETSPYGTSTTDNTSIYVLSLREMMLNGIQGFVGGEPGLSVRDLGELETKPVFRTRLDWYTSFAIYHGRSVARLAGIRDLTPVS